MSDLLADVERLGARWRLSAEERERLVRVLRQALLEGARAGRAGESVESMSFGSLLSQAAGRAACDGDTMWLDDEHDDFESVRLDPEVFAEGAPRVGRYIDLGALGEGAVGEVRRVLDRSLKRRMALKVLREGALGRADALARFIEEAQITAQLDHPSIVPVHELGRLDDGRVYFTMKEIRGRTLTQVIQELHLRAVDGAWPQDAGSWTLRRVLDAFLRATEAIAYAHSRGVVHRDIKPSNILLGSFGEVQVVDWGLAKVLDHERVLVEEDFVVTSRTGEVGRDTHVGRVAGTPSYMAPEQARGENDRVGPAADVHALGATLFRVLVGHPPYQGADAMEILDKVTRGEREPLRGALPIPEPLQEICERCLAFAAEDRYPDAGALAADLSAWVEGTRHRADALRRIQELELRLREAEWMRQQAARVKEEAATRLSAVRPHDPVDRKREGWALEDACAELEREADALEVEVVESLRALLTQVPELPEAHMVLADYFQARHVIALQARDSAGAQRAEQLLRAHHQGRYAAYLEGSGTLSVKTDPPGVEVELFEYVTRDRRLVPQPRGALGVTPLVDVRLPAGSYLLVLNAPGYEPLRCPALIERGRHWQVEAPDTFGASPLRLLPEGGLGADEVLVPQGWFISGGDPLAFHSAPRAEVWLDAFVARRFMVSNQEYLTFLNALVAEGHEELALRCAPREYSGVLFTDAGGVSWGRDGEGRFQLPPELQPDWPVGMVDFHSAEAYAAWFAAREGVPWRLPRELEWEKACRGVDGRFHSFGDHLDPTFCATPLSRPGPPTPASVRDFPFDESPYGVRGGCGNARSWCADVWREAGPSLRKGRMGPTPDDPGLEVARPVRGGSWLNERGGSRVAGRYPCRSGERVPYVGLRLVRDREG